MCQPWANVTKKKLVTDSLVRALCQGLQKLEKDKHEQNKRKVSGVTIRDVASKHKV